jgi:hypothetical protein
MDLLKKIGMVFAAGALSLSLASNIMADSKSDIEKEAEKYKNLEISGDDYNVLTWKMSNPQRELRCEYEVMPIDDYFDLINLKKMTGTNWEADKKEYQEFLMSFDSDMMGSYLYLEKDSDNDGAADKEYCYILYPSTKTQIKFSLSRIVEDKNRDGKYTEDEIVWDE